jgi:hypothetical protein
MPVREGITMAALARCFRPGGRAPRPEAHVETPQPAIRLPAGLGAGDFAQMAVSRDP